MFAVAGFKSDVCSITEADIEENPRLGFLRNLGDIVKQNALPSKVQTGHEFPFTGSDYDHVAGVNGKQGCTLMEVYEVTEEDSANGMIVKAKASCWCGRLVKHPVTMEFGLQELVTRVTAGVRR